MYWLSRPSFSTSLYSGLFIKYTCALTFENFCQGAPLSSDLVTFGGWRQAPWYALDACHPQVLAHLEALFRLFYSRWRIRYFKLDALFWGALHNGVRYQEEDEGECTRIQAYRRGLAAMRRGAPGAFFVGANHPIWASVGLLEASRLSSGMQAQRERERERDAHAHTCNHMHTHAHTCIHAFTRTHTRACARAHTHTHMTYTHQMCIATLELFVKPLAKAYCARGSTVCSGMVIPMWRCWRLVWVGSCRCMSRFLQHRSFLQWVD